MAKLSREQEPNLIVKAQQGDARAFYTLHQAYQALIWHIVKKNSKADDDLADLHAGGARGFWEAIQDVDPTKKGYRSYIYQRIEWSVKGRRREQGEGRRIHWKIRRDVLAAREELFSALEREPTTKEIAGRTGVSLDKVEDIILSPRRIVPLEDPSTPSSPPEGDDSMESAYEWFLHTLKAKTSNKTRAAAKKHLILVVLREQGGYEWNEIVEYLDNPEAEIGVGTAEDSSVWTVICEASHLPQQISREWPAITVLFSEPPPKLTVDAVRRNFSRANRKLKKKKVVTVEIRTI